MILCSLLRHLRSVVYQLKKFWIMCPFWPKKKNLTLPILGFFFLWTIEEENLRVRTFSAGHLKYIFYCNKEYCRKKKHKKETLTSILRAFTVGSLSFLYFRSSKNYLFSLATHFYKTPHIPLSILQYIILKYYKIIFFIYIFFFNTPNSLASTHPHQQHQQQ